MYAFSITKKNRYLVSKEVKEQQRSDTHNTTNKCGVAYSG